MAPGWALVLAAIFGTMFFVGLMRRNVALIAGGGLGVFGSFMLSAR
jgi:hypothetical protein